MTSEFARAARGTEFMEGFTRREIGERGGAKRGAERFWKEEKRKNLAGSWKRREGQAYVVTSQAQEAKGRGGGFEFS